MVGALALSITAPGCASSEEAQTEVSVAVAPDVGADGGAPNPASARGAAGACRGTVPGEIMKAAEAHVRFTVERICPGYVTITPGMTVQFTNDGDEAATVSMGDANGTETIWSAELAPDETVERTFDDLAVFSYTVSMIPTFRGVIEVREDDGT